MYLKARAIPQTVAIRRPYCPESDLMPLSNRRWNASRNELLLSIGLVATTAAVVAVLHIPGLTHGPTLDGAVFTEVADRLLHGGAPYVGAWDHKPPGIYWTLAAVRALIPGIDPWHVTWVVSVLATTGLALVAALLSEDLPQRAAIALVTAIYASAYPSRWVAARPKRLPPSSSLPHSY